MGQEVRECRDAMSTASGLREGTTLDYVFGRLLEARYGELVPGEFLTTDQFYEKWIGPRAECTGRFARHRSADRSTA